jgi:hypothetical protein
MDSESDVSSGHRRQIRSGATAAISDHGVGQPAEGAIDISIPADLISLEILRSVVGRASRMAGFSYDGIEDFALAVDEAATLLLETCPRDLALTLTTGLGRTERLEALVSAHDPTKSLILADLREDYRWDVLEALCEEVWWEDVGTSIGLAQSTR